MEDFYTRASPVLVCVIGLLTLGTIKPYVTSSSNSRWFYFTGFEIVTLYPCYSVGQCAAVSHSEATRTSTAGAVIPCFKSRQLRIANPGYSMKLCWYVADNFFHATSTTDNVYRKPFFFVGAVIGFANTMLILENLHIYRYSFQMMHGHWIHIDKSTMMHVKIRFLSVQEANV